MIIDLILDRYDGDVYNPHEFYSNVVSYHGTEIAKAMDFGNEIDVKKALCRYIDAEYNPKIKDFINKANWLVPDKATVWSKIVEI